jgi:hypothetical protein
LWITMVHRGSGMAYHHAVLGRRRLHAGALTAVSASMLAAQIRVLRKTEETLDLSPAIRVLIQNRLQVVNAMCELERAKLFLAGNRLGEAEESFRKANDFFHRPKLNLILRGLRTAPKLTRLGITLWNLWLNCTTVFRAAALFTQRLVIGPKNTDPV